VSESFLQIADSSDADRTPKRIVPDTIRERLHAMYAKVPSVSCECDKLGQCCELTPEEMAADFAAMYPLYPIEYLNIVDYVNEHFDADDREALAATFEERPERCPLLTEDGRCRVHPVRPLVCRTFGVLDREMVEVTAKKARGEVPASWVRDFLFVERQTVCPHARPLEPEAKEAHAQRMVNFEYERELIAMSREVDVLDAERREALEGASGRMEITRWSWGGFNALMRSPKEWFREHFGDYWKKCILGE
jgi:Fe-S-cluster containining protein